MISLIVAFIISLVNACAAGRFIWKWRDSILLSIGRPAYVFLAFSSLMLSGLSLAWVVCLLPPLNAPDSPYNLGYGGAPYGLQYELYPEAVGIFVALQWILLGYARLRVGRVNGSSINVMDATRRGGQPYISNFMLWGLATWVVLLTVVVMDSLGWDLLIQTPLPPDAYRRAEVSGVQGGGLAALSQLTGYLLILSSVVFIYCGWVAKRWGVAVVIGLFSSLPFFAIASRGLSVIWLTLWLLLLAKIARSGRMALVFGIPWTIVAVVIMIMPLSMRRLENAGVLFIIRQAPSLVAEAFSDDENSTILAISNASTMMPLLVESLARREGGDDLANTLSVGYRQRMLSPLPSFIDGYSSEYNVEKPKINPYTPYSTLGELVAVFGYVGVGIYAALLLLALEVCVFVRRRHSARPFFAMAVAIGMLCFVMFSTAYQTRASTRVLYFVLYVVVLMNFVPRFANNKRGIV